MSFPVPGNDWKSWARQVVAHFNRIAPNQEPNEPRPIQLPSWNATMKATRPGILMFDPVTDKVKVSTVAGAWVDV